MHLHLGPDFFGDHEHSRIGNDQRIRLLGLHIPQVGKIFSGSLEIIIVRQNIGRHINLHSMCMGECNSFRHFFTAEIFCLGPQSKSFSADINSIRAKNNSRF